MMEIVDTKDSRAVRNKNNVLELYELMINQKKSEEATAKFLSSAYVQHNPLIPGRFRRAGAVFRQGHAEHARARVVVHKIIAVGDYVWAHVNFLNLFNDDQRIRESPASTFTNWTPTAKAIEHWDALQLVGDPSNSAPWVAPNIPPQTGTACSEPL